MDDKPPKTIHELAAENRPKDKRSPERIKMVDDTEKFYATKHMRPRYGRRNNHQ